MHKEWPTIKVEVRDHVAWLTINRPERLNAMNAQMFRDLDQIADFVRETADVKAAVITGAGRAFCSGADLVDLVDEMGASNVFTMRTFMQLVAQVVKKWVYLEKPTLAAVHGPAMGGGCNTALMCDLVLMREDAYLRQVYTQRGLVLDMASTYWLPRLVGRARANELALFGDACYAADAERIGLANRCVAKADWDATVQQWAHRLAEGATLTKGFIKTGLAHSMHMSLEAVLEYEANAMSMIFQSEDTWEAFKAFQEKRPPKFQGR